MSTHGGDSFPGLNTLFGRVHRVSRSLVPSFRWFRSFVPSFRSFVPSFRSFVPYLQIHHTILKGGSNIFHSLKGEGGSKCFTLSSEAYQKVSDSRKDYTLTCTLPFCFEAFPKQGGHTCTNLQPQVTFRLWHGV